MCVEERERERKREREERERRGEGGGLIMAKRLPRISYPSPLVEMLAYFLERLQNVCFTCNNRKL